jgi:hypothetical protein
MGCVTVFTKATQTESNYSDHVALMEISGALLTLLDGDAVANAPVIPFSIGVLLVPNVLTDTTIVGYVIEVDETKLEVVAFV